MGLHEGVNGVQQTEVVSNAWTRSVALSAAARFKSMLRAPKLTFVMEAHDGLSARIAAREGFEAIWASGLAISTAHGLRDASELSWTETLRVVQYMTQSVEAAVVVDGDTGHGDFNSARRFASQAQAVGAAGVCFEDKLHPKMNSFVGDQHSLVPKSEFQSKLLAARAAVGDDFVLIARTEALIDGLGVREALRRLEGYRVAGADAVFVHSRQSHAEEIREFLGEWDNRCPVVLAPTTYAGANTADLHDWGASAVIWANQSMRASFSAMQRVCRELRQTNQAPGKTELASLDDVFALLDYNELAETADGLRLAVQALGE